MTKYEISKKRKAYFWGQGAEWLSIIILVLKGYRILDRRFKCKSGEIDLIAQKSNMICFIEVKARKNKQDALYALSKNQMQRIIKAAQWYLAKNNHGLTHSGTEIFCRFDVIAVEPWRWPTHVKNAWQASL